MGTAGAGGLRTVGIEALIARGAHDWHLPGDLQAARAELAALLAAVERHHQRADMLQGALEDAARHIGPPEDYSRNSDDGMWDLASRIAWVLQTFGEPEIADGPGAAGARDETAALRAVAEAAPAVLDWANRVMIVYDPEDVARKNADMQRLHDALAALDALRAGGAGA